MPCLYLGPLLVDSWPCDYLCLLSLLRIVLAPMQPNLCHVRTLVGCRFNNGATISNIWCHDETESLLWQPTQGCAAQQALVLRFLVMTHYGTTPMSCLLVSFSLVISPYLIERSIYQTKSSRISFRSCKRDNLEEQITDINNSRL